MYPVPRSVVAGASVFASSAHEILLALPLRIVRPVLADTATVYGGCATTLARTIDLLAAITRGPCGRGA